MKLALALSNETTRILDAVADDKGMEPEKLVHQWFRDFLWVKPHPAASSVAAQASALMQRGALPGPSGRKFTKAELEALASTYAVPDIAPGDGPHLFVELTRRVSDILPRCVAYVDLTLTAEARTNKEWNDLSSWAVEYVTAKCADLGAELDAKEAADEESALYPSPSRPKNV